MTKTTYALMAANFIVWGYFIWSGFEGLEAIRAQHAPGYPNNEQIEYYVLIPSFMAAISIAVPLLLQRTRWHSVGTGALVVMLPLSLLFGCFYTGGM